MRPSRSRRCAESLLAALALAAPAAACPCGAPAGAFPAWTALDERVTVTALTGWSREIGSFDARSRALPQPRGVRSDRVTLDLLAAWRAHRSVELALGVAAAWTRTELPGIAAEGFALGDTSLRARWESPVPVSPAAPAVALWGAVRAPTGGRDLRANGLTSVGLGHWELGLGVETRWRFGLRWSLSVGAELGLRAPADVGGTTYTPGPRAAALLSVIGRPTDRLAISLGLSAWLEAAPWLDGVAAEDAVVHRVGPALGLSWQVVDAVRVLGSVSVDALVDGLGANSPANVRATLGLSWAALRD
jgi:hypothetical protein